MASGIWTKLKEMVQKMIPKKNIEEVLHVTPMVSDRMADAIQLWSDMYEGNSPWLKEPTSEDPERVVSLGLPAFIASEKARMVTLEMKSEITAPEPESSDTELNLATAPTPIVNSERAEYLEKQYKKLKKQLRRQLEYGIAKGGLVIKPYVVQRKVTPSNTDYTLQYSGNLDTSKIEFDYIQADRFFPLSFDANGEVIEAAFIQTKADKAKERVYIRLEYHKLEGTKVTVQNLAFESTDMSLANSNNIKSASNLGKQIPLSQVSEWASLQETTVIDDVDRLLFAYFKMPDANTVDPYSPLGVSGFSRAISLIKDADEQYSRLLWEYEGSELALDVDRDAMRYYEERGTQLPSKQQRLFRKVDLNAEDTYNVFTPPIRDISILNGLNNIFMRIEDVCGLSRGVISDVNVQEIRTATELKIQKQRSYASNADIQAALQDTLDDVVYIMDVYCTLYNLTPEGEYDVSYEWDDSIIMDAESELAKRITLLQNGLASKLETRMWYFGETENQARMALERVHEEAQQAVMDNLEAEQQMQAVTGGEATGQTVKSAGDTTSAKKSSGIQADSLENPDKSKTIDSIKI